jgi:hypothetical protein
MTTEYEIKLPDIEPGMDIKEWFAREIKRADNNRKDYVDFQYLKGVPWEITISRDGFNVFSSIKIGGELRWKHVRQLRYPIERKGTMIDLGIELESLTTSPAFAPMRDSDQLWTLTDQLEGLLAQTDLWYRYTYTSNDLHFIGEVYGYDRDTVNAVVDSWEFGAGQEAT